MIEKIFNTLFKFTGSLSLLVGVFLFAVIGSYESMLICGAFSLVMFIKELLFAVSERTSKKGRQNESKKATRSK